MTKSTPKRFSQHQLTRVFLETAGISVASSQDLKYKIWYNPTEDTSLRLSLEGYRFLVQVLKLKTYKFELEEPLNNKNLLQLERHFQGMYYLNKSQIFVVFDEQEAAMLTLYNGDLKLYLNNLEDQQS